MLRDDARAIWNAGVAAVDSERLVKNVVSTRKNAVTIAGREFPLGPNGRLVAIGAGKAGAGMAAGLEAAIGLPWLERLSGWINVPEDCVRPLKKIHLHPARPAGVNEPTAAGVAGTEEILRLADSLGPEDLCVVLLSGGGSALLPGPASPVTLADKQQVTRALAGAGANIAELNTVRKQLSTVKGGRLAARIGAGQIVTLIISDVMGDPLDVIASGPTVADTSTPRDAQAILERYLNPDDVPETVRERLATAGPVAELSGNIWNHVIGNNELAVAAAAAKARQMGYRVKMAGSDNDGPACEWGRSLAEAALSARDHQNRPFCIVAGGETTVALRKTPLPRSGGRNQEIALGAAGRLWKEPLEGIVVLSGGTDGEDGPTDAAGALVDLEVVRQGRRLKLDPPTYLAINNSYPFFKATGGLFKTGPTHTNVMDLQVVLAEPKPKQAWIPRQQWNAMLDEERPARPKRTAKPGRSK